MLMFLAIFLCILGVGGLVADHLFAHSGIVAKFINSLPMMHR